MLKYHSCSKRRVGWKRGEWNLGCWHSGHQVWWDWHLPYARPSSTGIYILWASLRDFPVPWVPLSSPGSSPICSASPRLLCLGSLASSYHHWSPVSSVAPWFPLLTFLPSLFCHPSFRSWKKPWLWCESELRSQEDGTHLSAWATCGFCGPALSWEANCSSASLFFLPPYLFHSCPGPHSAFSAPLAAISVNTLPGSLSDLFPEGYPVIGVLDRPLLPVTLPTEPLSPATHLWGSPARLRFSLPALSCKCTHSQEGCHIKSRMMETSGCDYPAEMYHGSWSLLAAGEGF